MRVLALAVLASVLAMGEAPSAPSEVAAAPRIILLHDGLMSERRVFMTDWNENLTFMLSTTQSADVDPEELVNAPVVRAALFWGGPKWERYVDDPELLNTLSPGLAEQHARIYPATEGREALFVMENVFGGGPNPRFVFVRRLGPEGVEILRRHDVLTEP